MQYSFSIGQIDRIAGNAFATAVIGGMAAVVQNPGLINDHRVVTFDGFSGLYDLTFRHYMDPNGGIVTVYLNGALIATVDLYTAVGFPEVVTTVAGVTLLTGENLLSFQVDSKNGASGGYRAYQGWLYLTPQ